jgi:hypothetical protein
MIKLIASLTVLALATPALAQEKPRKGLDPNRVICRTQEVLGSRLQSERKCMTAAQWTQLQRDQRDTVERSQRLEGRGN